MIDWSKLKPYKNDKAHSFEELCYQLAKVLYGDSGTFTSIDDSGGGDGVEFYLTWPNGDEWGWQAKFYHPELRLSTSNRKAEIKNSLEVACQKHPNLKRWILCTPTNFTTDKQTANRKTEGELTWFNKTLAQAKPADMEVELEHWGDSEFGAWLAHPRFAGKRLYFFGELELTLEWFRTQVSKQLRSLGDKYNSKLHIETYSDAKLHRLLGDQDFIEVLDRGIEQIATDLHVYDKDVADLIVCEPEHVSWGTGKQELLRALSTLRASIIASVQLFGHARDLLGQQQLDQIKLLELAAKEEQLWQAYHACNLAREQATANLTYTGPGEEKEKAAALEPASISIWDPSERIDGVLGSVSELFGLLHDLTQSDLHLLGAAGMGKSHTAAHICDTRLEASLPALLVLGRYFTTEAPLTQQLLEILDVPRSYSWSNFLQALSSAAEAYRTRIPLIIDGLNEATINGKFSSIWRTQLAGLIAEIEPHHNVVLITTCRDTYQPAIWPEGKPANTAPVAGFDWGSVGEAVRAYFAYYKINANLTATSLDQFAHPIYLKIFCESQNPKRATEIDVHIGEQTLFDVFEAYLAQVNHDVCIRLGWPPRANIINPALNLMAEYLWNQHARSIAWSTLAELLDGRPPEAITEWERSKTKVLEDEGLILCRDWDKEGEIVSVTYDLMAGYLIARYLLSQAGEDLAAFVHADTIVAALFTEDYQTLHPLYSDIVRCLAALLPAQYGCHLYQLTDNRIALMASLRAFFEMEPKYLTEAVLTFIQAYFLEPELQRTLLSYAKATLTQPSHPLNAAFWSKQLKALAMPARDVTWTEYIRQDRYWFDRFVEQVEAFCQDAAIGTDPLTTDRLALLAEYMMWILTSTVRPLRDKTTRALYWYGRRFPQHFLALLQESFAINDPYIRERMLAAAYGVAMARQYDFADASFAHDELPRWARLLYDAMFARDAPFSTTHILARDYARRLIEIARMHHPDLLQSGEIERIIPPFQDGGLREWGQSEEQDYDNRSGLPAPLQMDFKNYTLGRLISERKNYDDDHPEYKTCRANIYWRIYALGYSLERFGELDLNIVRSQPYQSRGADNNKIDRYGKKYSWIAYFELAGYLADQGFRDEQLDDARRGMVDIDPSFPAALSSDKLVDEDWLGDRNISTDLWIQEGGLPNINPFLLKDKVQGKAGPWVLLSGLVDQEDQESDRNRFTFVRGLLIQATHSEEILQRLEAQFATNQSTSNHWIPEIPSSYYTYAGEIPWCDTFPANEEDELVFVLGTTTHTIAERKFMFRRNGQLLAEEELHQLLSELKPSIEGHDEAVVEEVLERHGVELAMETVETEQEVAETKAFPVLVPMRDYSWESYHSAVNPGERATTLTQQIALELALVSQPQTFDLYSAEGQPAAQYLGYTKEPANRQSFLYIRLDLLDNYLRQHNLKLLWIIWGERQHSISTMATLISTNRDTGPAPWHTYQQFVTYDELPKNLV